MGHQEDMGRRLNLENFNLEDDYSKVFSCIYCIINKVDHKMYIGVTIGKLSKRFYHHLWELRRNSHSNPHMQNSYNLYGEDSFVFGYIEKDIPESLLNEKEIDHIKNYSSTNRLMGYNILEGGVRKTHSKETRDKLSEKRKKAYLSGELKHPFLGKKHTEETKVKLSKASTGRKNGPCSDDRKLQISISNKGKKRTKEFCEAISRRKKGTGFLGDNPNSKSLKIINPKTGEVKTYTNTIDAGKEFNICPTFIRDLCREKRVPEKGKLKGLILLYI